MNTKKNNKLTQPSRKYEKRKIIVDNEITIMIIFLIINVLVIRWISSAHFAFMLTDDYHPSTSINVSRENEIRELIIREYNNKIYQHVAGMISIFIAFFSFRKDNYFLDSISGILRKIVIAWIFWLRARRN
jgi:hypothetical protein